MLGQTSLLDEKTSLPLQVETDQAALSQDVASRGSTTRFLWTGLGFGVMMLMGVSACALHPLPSHASAEPSQLAFNPMPALGPRAMRPAIHPASGPARAFRPAVRPGLHAMTPNAGQQAPGVQFPKVPPRAGVVTGQMSSQSLDDATDEFTPAAKPIQLPREEWPERKLYRFIKEEDLSKALFKFQTPVKYQGTRNTGTYKGSSRVTFAPPRKSHSGMLSALVDEHNRAVSSLVPKTIELLKSNEQDNPSFGAVEVKLPLDMSLTQSNSVGKLSWLPIDVKVEDLDSRKRLVVTNVKGGNAEFSRIQRGDIIRAVSVPAPDGAAEKPWWGQVFQTAVPAAEEGMAMLDGMAVSQYDAVLAENKRQNQDTVVLLIERPINLRNGQEDEGFSGGLRLPSWGQQPQMEPVLVPIPIPVEPDRRPGDAGNPGAGEIGGRYGPGNGYPGPS
jgi:hypothetical protein